MVRNNNMETTFYDDHNYQHHNMASIKRSMTLELGGGGGVGGAGGGGGPLKKHRPVLSSPDLNMFKMSSPDLEKFIQGGALVTPSPAATQLLFPAAPTEAQEMYARPFMEALNDLHHSDSSQGPYHPQEPHPAVTYTDLEKAQPGRPYPHHFPEGNLIIKDEPQTVPSIGSSPSPPLSPIDMDSQEKIKLERKRQRNRVAASKCRRRKLERISRLEDKVKLLKGENNELNTVVMRLKEHVCTLKQQVMEHVQSGCQMIPIQ